MPDKPDLTALLGSRICHDLISPIGAIGNGVELLMMEGSTKSPEIALILDSVTHANARIRFFRMAFGASGRDQRVGRAEVLAILSDLTQGGRLSISWNSPPDLNRRDVKLVFLLIQCLESALAYGGRIEATQTDGRWLITGRAPKLKVDAALWEMLVNPASVSEIGPAQVQFLLVPEEFSRQHRRLTAQLGETEIRLSF
jgi:histidine phosphotransferase ChpT